MCYCGLILVGLSNLIRFYRVRQISSTLVQIYIFSLVMSFSWVLDLSFAQHNNLWQYLPFVMGVYSKILFGISYQQSIFDLKYIVGFYFKSDRLQLDESTFKSKTKRMNCVMVCWRLAIIVYFILDVCYNYIDDYFIHRESKKESFMNVMLVSHTASYYVSATMFLLLTVLIIWQTIALINIIKIMGDLLKKEQARLKILMVTFSLSYLGLSTYYIVQAYTDLNCSKWFECVRFVDLASISFVLFFFDVIPLSVLYYQHY